MRLSVPVAAVVIGLNLELDEALRHTGYKGSQKIFTSLQVELIFRYLGQP